MSNGPPYVEQHVRYEMMMLRYAWRRMQSQPDHLLYNAMYECFIVHARNMVDFLKNFTKERKNRANAVDFNPLFLATASPSVDTLYGKIHDQVLHMGDDRRSETSLKLEQLHPLVEWIEENYTAFLAALGLRDARSPMMIYSADRAFASVSTLLQTVVTTGPKDEPPSAL